MIATGTDVRPLEVVFFMRDVKSKNYFEQMKGRGMRVIEPNDLVQVTPDAKSKDRFLIVDAVGVSESIKTESYSLDRKKGVSATPSNDQIPAENLVIVFRVPQKSQ